jgi:LuxR family maltose regulon positive regulatory protein
MAAPLLQIKVEVPPLRTEIVQRKRLLDLLSEGCQAQGGFSRKLTLFSAPAGYGKTTLMLAWTKRLGLPLAWLALDETDNDPARFLAYLIAAIQQVHMGFGSGMGAILKSPQKPPDTVILTMLVNEMASIPVAFVFVLDDYHAIHTLGIHQQLTFLLEHQPANLHLVIGTREDPLLPIPRLRARGQVLEIRQENLRFSVEETASFLSQVMGLKLAPDQVAALERRTEGWIAGLQLAGLSMRGHGDVAGFIHDFTGSSRYILDYLIEEVFDRQTPGLKSFLLRTSILERFSARLCDSVAERNDSQPLLESLEQANLFIVPLDQSRTWYRYHLLFAELLRHRLRLSGLNEADLHIRACEWFENNGYLADAVQHALAAQDWGRAKSLLQHVTSDMLKRGEVATLLRWYSSLPEDDLTSDPRFCFDYCWILLLAGKFEEVAPLLDHMEQVAQGIPEFLGEVLAAQAFLARGQGDYAGMVEKSRKALGLLSENSVNSRGLVALNLGVAYWHMGRMEEAEKVLMEAREAAAATGNTYGEMTAVILQGRVLAVRGHLHKAKVVFEQAIESGGMIPINALAHLDLCALHYEWNDLPESDTHLQIAMELSQRGRNDEHLVSCWMMMSCLRIAQANISEAQDALAKAQGLVNGGKIPALTADRLDSASVQFALVQGDLASARRLADKLKDDVDSRSFCRFIGLTKAYLMLADERGKEAREYLDTLYQKAFENNWRYGLIAVRVSQALAAETTSPAQMYLAEALQLAEPEGFIRVFVDGGKEVVPLLQEAMKRGVAVGYVKRILAELGEKPHETVAGNGFMIEPLSGREIEVLKLVTTGMSNREIAAKLFISAGTAKTHIHHLCGKLGVRNRTEAAMKAKQLGLA